MVNKKKKYIPHDIVMAELREQIKNPKPKMVINKDLKKTLEKMINKVVKKDARSEAMKLLKLASESEIGSFLYYYHYNSHSICCMVLDSIKDRAWKEGKLPKKIGNKFGLECKPGFIGNKID